MFTFISVITGQVQEDGEGYEIFIINCLDSAITISDSAVSVVWDEDEAYTTKYQKGSFIVPPNASRNTYKYGFWYASLTDGAHTVSNSDTLGYGLYKINTITCENLYGICDKHFYIDTRDGNFINGGTVDIEVRIGLADYNNWEWKRWENCDGVSDTNWIELEDGDTLRIWEIWDECSNASWAESDPNLSVFQPTTPIDFSLSWVNNQVQLNWSASEPGDPICQHRCHLHFPFLPELSSNITDTDIFS